MPNKNNKITVSIVGASGYAGGEILRLLLFHPNVEIKEVTSENFRGKNVGIAHPNLRGVTNLRFISYKNLDSCDLLILCLPNLISVPKIDFFKSKAKKIIDTGADFRLNNKIDYQKWYQIEHPKAELLNNFIYGIAELHREEIKKTDYVACAGCEATVSILSLSPLFKEKAVENDEVFIDAKIGSSAAGNKPNKGSHHPERAGCYRSYKLTGHRHIAEIVQEVGAKKVHLSATAVEMVRGILITAQLKIKPGLTERDIRKIYRIHYGKEPFIRIIKERQGIYRYPEPKLLQGTNYCDIGFEFDEESNRLVVVGAIDNLGKGTAGQVVQAMNLMFGFQEKTALEFPGLHPV
jgi:N-acetyl-gamma-glutamyl-phosphate/LysW-gamma-L-alpha-aminoadipyl-6-phosphate reductase